MEAFTSYDVVKRLIGQIQPAGDSGIDERRYANLVHTIALVEALMSDIQLVSQLGGAQQASVSKAGRTAEKFIHTLCLTYGESYPNG